VQKTLYDLLGVRPDATTESLKSGYLRQLAWLRGPNTGLTADDAINRLKALEEAFSLLNDPVRRTHYDLKLRKQNTPEPSFDSGPNFVKWGLIFGVCILGWGVQHWYSRIDVKVEEQRKLAIAQGEAKLLEERQQQQADAALQQEEAKLRREQESRAYKEQQELDRLKHDADRHREQEISQREAEQRAAQRQRDLELERQKIDEDKERRRVRRRLGLGDLPQNGD